MHLILRIAIIFLGLFVHFASFAQKGQYLDSLSGLTESPDMQLRASSLLKLAKHYYNKDSILSVNYYNEFLNLNIASLEDSTKEDILEEHTTFLRSTFQYRKAVDLLNSKLKEEETLKDSAKLANCHRLITSHYFYLFEYDSCLYHIDRAINLYSYLKDTSKLGILVLRKSGISYATGKYEIAIKYAFEATEYFKTNNDKKQTAIAYLQIGNIFYFLDNFSEAKKYYELSAIAFLNCNDDYGYYSSISNIGLVNTDLGNYDSSIVQHMRTLQYFKEENLELELGNTYQYLSGVYYEVGEIDSAIHYNQLSINFNRKTHYIVGEALDLLLQSKIAFDRGNYKYALAKAKEGYQLSDSVFHQETVKDIALQLSKVYEKLNQVDSGYKYLKVHANLRDSLDLNVEELKDYAILHQFQVEEAQFKLLLAESQAEIQEKIHKKRESQLYVAIIISILSFALLILAIIFLVRNRKLTKNLGEKQKQLKEELLIKESLLSEIHHRVKNNLQVVSSMLSLQSQYINDAELQKIIADCKGRITSMSLIHESLYKKIDGKEASFSKYIQSLIPQLIETYQIDESKIKLKMEVEDVYLNLDESIPCGLIINEIVSNSLKHAFPSNRNGEIKISLKKNDNLIQLNISDNGIGFRDKGIEQFDKEDSFGFLLINTLASQLEAELQLTTEGGLSYLISWETKS